LNCSRYVSQNICSNSWNSAVLLNSMFYLEDSFCCIYFTESIDSERKHHFNAGTFKNTRPSIKWDEKTKRRNLVSCRKPRFAKAAKSLKAGEEHVLHDEVRIERESFFLGKAVVI